MKFIYVIGHRGTNEYRLKNLIHTIDWVSQFDVEIVVIEQDDCPKLQNILSAKKVKYIFAKNSNLYNRSWSFNIAHRHNQYDVMICADNDMVMKRYAFSELFKACETFDVVSPFSRLYDLSEAQSINFNPETINRTDSGRGGMNFTSGICAIKRSMLESIGGWDERFEGWGGEDDAMTHQITLRSSNIIQLKNECFHLYHPRTTTDGTHLHNKYNNNLDFLKEHRENRYNNIDIKSKGFLNKYE
jgi:GT2 family glycosyltransferase